MNLTKLRIHSPAHTPLPGSPRARVRPSGSFPTLLFISAWAGLLAVATCCGPQKLPALREAMRHGLLSQLGLGTAGTIESRKVAPAATARLLHVRPGSRLAVTRSCEPRPCVINCRRDRLHVFYRDESGTIVHVFRDDDDSSMESQADVTAEAWAGPDATGAPPAEGDPATAWTRNGHLHLFYRDVHGSLQHLYQDTDLVVHREVWAEGAGSSTAGPAAAGDPALLVDPMADQLHVFYRDVSGNIQHVFLDPESGMKADPPWGEGAVGTPAAIFSGESRLLCIRNCAHNQQHLFYRDTSKRILHLYYDREENQLHGPFPWAGPGSPNEAPAASGDPTALFTPDMQQHLFYRDVTDVIEHVFWDDPSSNLRLDAPWGAGAVGNPTPLFTTETRAFCRRCAHDQQGLFIRTSSRQLAYRGWDEQDRRALGPGAWSLGADGDPVAISSTGMRENLFFADASGNLQQVYWVPPGSGAFDLHQETWSGPATRPSDTPAVSLAPRSSR